MSTYYKVLLAKSLRRLNKMSVGHKKTLDLKRKECAHCKKADKRAMRQGRDFCPVKNPKIRNGHCLDSELTGKRGKVED